MLALDWVAYSGALTIPSIDELELETSAMLIYCFVRVIAFFLILIAATMVNLTVKGSELLKLWVLVIRCRPLARK